MRSPRPAVGTVVCLSLAASVAAVAAGMAPAAAAPPSHPFVAELHYDNAGTDQGEFVEVQVQPGTSTAGWSIVLYNGSGGVTYGSTPLPAVSAPADGSPTVAVVAYPSNGIQNGSPDGLALVDDAGVVVELLSYEGSFTATNGPAAGSATTDIGVAESGSEPAGQSLSRRLDAATGELAWQPPAPATRDAVNPPLEDDPGEACESVPTHEISDVQGVGFATPLAGSTVTVRGVVVGDLPGLGGFHLQDVDGDGSDATSDGVFVLSSAPVSLGDDVQVTGAPREDFGQTELVATTTETCGTGELPSPAPLDLPADAAAKERLEGMLVDPVDVLTVSEVFDLVSFGELLVSEGGLLVQPTELARPGPEADAIVTENALRSLVLDDGSNRRTSVTGRPYLSASTPVRVGDELTFTAPLVLGYDFGAYRLQPADGTPEGTFAPQDTRPAEPDPVGGDIQVASFNVLNYFLTRTGPDARGARTDAEFEEQAAKIVPAILALDAEVVALLEIEDTASTGYGDGSPDQALADLVARLNQASGEPVWSYVPLPDELLAVERDVIRNAIIFRDDAVQPVGEPVGLVDEAVWDNAREPIAQTFVRDGDAFTVIANHFKSKSPGTDPAPSGDNVDAGDGQGAWNGDRTRQAASLAAFAEQFRAVDEDVLLLGDLNAYSEEDPVVVLRDAGYADLGAALDPGRYSYVFDGRSGSLDHAMASAALGPKVTGAAHWNVNAVESFAYQYSGDPALYAADPYRSSDHDPIVIGIDLEERCAGLLPTIRGTAGDDVLRGTNRPDVIMGLGGNDRIDGLNGDDVLCGGLGEDVLLGGNGADVVRGGFGDDDLAGGNGDDDLTGGPADDALDGGHGDDVETADGPES